MVGAVSPQRASTIELVATEADAGVRLDKLLAQRIDTLSRARIQALIRAGNVAGGGGATIGDGSYRVKPGEAFAVRVPEPELAEPAGEAIALDISGREALLGMPVSSSPGVFGNPRHGAVYSTSAGLFTDGFEPLMQ